MTLHLRTLTDEWAKIGRLTRAHHRRGGDRPDRAVHAGVSDWNQHPTAFLWGRPPKPRRQLKRRQVYEI